MNFLSKILFSKVKGYIDSKTPSEHYFENYTSEHQKDLGTINDKLLKYKEFKYIYQKTRIKPVYIMYILLLCLIIMVIGYLEYFLTCLIGVLYPLYFSIKSLREKNKTGIRRWLQYWIVFSFFLNIEYVFSIFLTDIPLYFFFKVIFLLVCFLPQYNGAKYFYENFIKIAFNKYEKELYEISKNVAKRLKTTLMESDSESEEED
jgi:receptor expression-enhancing protein 5/6